MKDFQIYAVSESMLTISVGDAISLDINRKVFQIYDQLLRSRHPSWKDIIPAYSTVSILYDTIALRKQHASAFEWMKEYVGELISGISSEESFSSRSIQVPVCYDPEFAVDANRLAHEKNISFKEVISIHTSRTYHVFMIGFLPGFAYMGSVDPRIAAPRIPSPRINVVAGSVGIAGEQTGIYPLDSPGGWNIIGRTPLKIFVARSAEPVLFQPGDQVSFVPITRKDFDFFDPSTFKLER